MEGFKSTLSHPSGTPPLHCGNAASNSASNLCITPFWMVMRVQHDACTLYLSVGSSVTQTEMRQFAGLSLSK
jgi:hypothetical protein